MNNSRGGQPPKKETVYSGPAPAGFGGASQSGTAVATREGTVYNGPAADGTVFDESKFVPKKADRSVAIAATKEQVQRRSILFFVTSGISLIEYFLYRGHDPVIAGSCLAIFAIFLVIGIFAMRMSRVAFLIAMTLYGLDSAILLWWALTTDFGLFFVARPLLVRGFILYRLYRSYGMLVDLHTD